MEPTRSSVTEMLRIPAYVGAFVYGRTQTDPSKSGRNIPVPIEDWIQVVQDIYPAYITWQQYLANRSRISQNYASFIKKTLEAKGVPRGGVAILPGLVLCGDCGAHMKVNYTPQPWYFCDYKKKQFGGAYCPSHPASCVDKAILEAFFEAIRPGQINTLDDVLAKNLEEREQRDRHWQHALKRAQFKCLKAQESYDAVDARHRLVAETLESRWESSLQELRQVEQAYEDFKTKDGSDYSISPELRERLRHISTSLPQMWSEGKVSAVKLKELLRCLIAHVVLKKTAADEIETRIAWTSGGCWIMPVSKSIHTFSNSPRYEEIVERIHTLWRAGLTDQDIAKQLSSEGFRSPRGTPFLCNTVLRVRVKYSWRSVIRRRRQAISSPKGYLSTKELAKRLGVTLQSVYRYIKKGYIPRKHIIAQKAAFFIKDCDQVFSSLHR